MGTYTSTHTGQQIDTALCSAEIFAQLGYTCHTTTTIGSTSYNCIWTTTPTSSNQIYGLTVINGRLYRVYNNRGTYSILAALDVNTDRNIIAKSNDANASTAAKIAKMPSFELQSGQVILLWNTLNNTSGTALTLNINGTGAKSMWLNGSATSSSNYSYNSGFYTAEYDGTNWKLTRIYWTDTNTNTTTSGVVNSTSGSTIQTANFHRFELYNGQSVIVKLNASTSATTLNINSTGAKPILQNGTAIGTSNAILNTYYVATYNGTSWLINKLGLSSSDSSSKLYLVGATSQEVNPTTYSDNEVYTTSGVLTTKSVQVGGGNVTLEYNTTEQCLEFKF